MNQKRKLSLTMLNCYSWFIICGFSSPFGCF